MSKKTAQPALKIIPLGGLHEIGKNTCVFEYDDEILLLDAGLAFPTDSMHGVNIVLPDMTYLRENRHKIKGAIATHGHEDHIGGFAHHLKQFDIPIIYGPRLALSLLADKLEEAGVSKRTKLKTVAPREVVRIGKSFSIEFIRNTHSIADSFTLAITTPVGVVIFTGDFKVDHTPVDGEYFDLHRLAQYGEKGVLCLLSDSTNSEVPGFTPSERSVYPSLDRAFSQAPGRLIVTTFASSVHRLNLVLELAQKHDRYVSAVGRSMLNVIAHARNLGYIKCPDALFKPIHEIRQLPDEKVLILCTGSQGEHMAAVSRIARKEHRQVQIKPGDTVVFSANPIPGNTISVVNTIDALMKQGATVLYGRQQGLHVSGHGCQEDQKLMLSLTRPKFFMPVHGEHRMLVQHCKTAQSLGISPSNMVVVDNGDVVELTQNSIRIADRVPSGIELVDSSRTGMVPDAILKERQQLAEDGVVTVATAIGWDGKLTSHPEVHIRGVVSTLENAQLKQRIVDVVERTLNDRASEFIKVYDGKPEADWVGVQTQLEVQIQRMLRRELQSNPMLVVLLQTPMASVSPSKVKEKVTESPVPVTGRRRQRASARVAS
ncbi:MAG TPA: ribonuclease J [Oscillatoriales cyanobacterium M59_W2019_021]|nr:MAG: ribonuclease J [Cyanobacteria bacterium J055]HIK31725.1 ribonuclease J [Oscillatoriales cyanobacterium M4454_W2019_049]HIK49644.1 ribonuclease J [Oscillatoriales cyanobacterium M59_W2019_021]